jgi:tRNA (guanine37-N1)-methyltransferase
MQFQILTLFPEFIQEAQNLGVLGQAIRDAKIKVSTHNPRDFAIDAHRRVDDRPFGGGDGMVMMLEPLIKTMQSLKAPGRVIYLTPQGRKWNDQSARAMALLGEPVTLICGRYSGIDQRFINAYVTEEISIGDYVLTGGELAALVVMDSISRFVPGVLGNPDSPEHESFKDGLLEGPLFTRPRQHALGDVPEVFIEGDHAKLADYRNRLARLITAWRRPDLARFERNQLRREVDALKKIPIEDLAALGLSNPEFEKWMESL